MDLDDSELRWTRKQKGLATEKETEEYIRSLESKLNKEKEKNKELEEENKLQRQQLNSAFDNGFIHKDLLKNLLKEINKEYLRNEEIFNKHFEKENRDMQDYYIQKEATNIMQEISWLEGKIEELLEGDK